MSDFTKDLRIIGDAFEHEKDEWVGYCMIHQAADMIDQQQTEIERLREEKKQISNAYIKLFIDHIETLDNHLPEWREFCKDQIDQLSAHLK